MDLSGIASACVWEILNLVLAISSSYSLLKWFARTHIKVLSEGCPNRYSSSLYCPTSREVEVGDLRTDGQKTTIVPRILLSLSNQYSQ